jgi:hypothetical protein
MVPFKDPETDSFKNAIEDTQKTPSPKPAKVSIALSQGC